MPGSAFTATVNSDESPPAAMVTSCGLGTSSMWSTASASVMPLPTVR